MARLQRGADQVERIRELFGKAQRPLAPQPLNDDQRDRSGHRGDRQRDERAAAEQQDEHEADEREERDIEQDFAHAPLEPRLPDHAHQTCRQRDASEQCVEEADAREALVLEHGACERLGTRARHGFHAAGERLLLLVARARPGRERIATERPGGEDQECHEAKHGGAPTKRGSRTPSSRLRARKASAYPRSEDGYRWTPSGRRRCRRRPRRRART